MALGKSGGNGLDISALGFSAKVRQVRGTDHTSTGRDEARSGALQRKGLL